MKEKETLLKVKNLNKIFKNKNVVVKAINNVSFDVKKGEVVGLIGESGSGKTTIGRTVIGLHEATSGIIELENKDITNYSMRKVRKNVVRNIQMIFQDPYSSLNAQKNVLSLVSEPVIANKLWKEEVELALKNRNKILKYYKFSLIDWYFEKFNAYRIYANKIAFNFSNKLNKKLLKFKIDPKENKETNFNTLLSLFYRERHEGNFKILEKLVDTEELLFSKWAKFNDNIVNLKNIPYDEKALIKIDQELQETKALISHSQAVLDLKQAIKIEEAELKKTHDNKNFEIARAKNNYKKIKNLLKEDYTVVLTEKKLANTNELYDFYNKKVIIAKAKVEFLKQTWNELSHKMWFDMEYASNFFITDFVKAKGKETFVKALKKQIEKLVTDFEKNSKKLKNKILKLQTELKVEIQKPRSKEVQKYKDLFAKKTLDKKEAVKVFEKETKIFLEKFNVEQKAKKEAAKEEIHQNLDNYKKLKAENKKLFDELIKKIEIDFKDKNDLPFKKMKDIIKKEEDKNDALEIELKNINKNIKIVRQLFGIQNSLKPLLFLALRRLIIRNKVYESLRHAGLKSSYAYRYPHEFSGGMRQRVGIARAIIGKPKLIIADEPIAALDLSIQAQVVNMLLDQRDRLDLAMIFIAHDLSMVHFNSDRVLIMHLGRIVEYGDTEKIFKNPVHPYTINLMKSMPTIKKAKDKIEVFEFKPDYLKSYTATNQPKYFEVKSGHFVLATAKQYSKWN